MPRVAPVVPTADALERPGKSLEEGTDVASRLVERLKRQCNDLATYQGVYVATPGGLLLAGSHEATHDPRKVERLLRRGLARWGQLSPAERLVYGDTLTVAVAELKAVEGESRFPRDGLVLRVVCRDLPRGGKAGTSPGKSAYNLLPRQRPSPGVFFCAAMLSSRSHG
jgi:hypothetical protein